MWGVFGISTLWGVFVSFCTGGLDFVFQQSHVGTLMLDFYLEGRVWGIYFAGCVWDIYIVRRVAPCFAVLNHEVFKPQ